MLYAGATKWSELSAFVRTVGQFGIVDDRLVRLTAIGLLAVELTAGVVLLMGLRRALATVFGLLALYAAALIYGIGRGFDIDCGCFGPEDPLAGKGMLTALARVLTLMAVCGAIAILQRRCTRRSRGDPKA